MSVCLSILNLAIFQLDYIFVSHFIFPYLLVCLSLEYYLFVYLVLVLSLSVHRSTSLLPAFLSHLEYYFFYLAVCLSVF
jgi:hypothetical protein